MRWNGILEADEELCWEGRPAPRCYTLRNWVHSLFGLVLLVGTAFWQKVGIELAEGCQSVWLIWLPLPFLLLSLYLSFGHLILARIEWNRVYYAVTDRHLLLQRGLFKLRVEKLELSEVTYFRLKPHGRELGSLLVYGADAGRKLSFVCVEYPRKVTDLIEAAMGEKAQPVSAKAER